jgi:hypothetical protein
MRCTKHCGTIKWIAKVCILIALAYGGSYVALSANGAYEPGILGPAGIKEWMWVPVGMRSWDEQPKMTPLWYFYCCPLYALDIRCWHDDWSGRDGPRRIPPGYEDLVREGGQRASPR